MNFLFAKLCLWRSRRLKPLDQLDFIEQFRGVRRILVYLPPEIEQGRLEYIVENVGWAFPECTIEFLLPVEFPSELKQWLTDHRCVLQQVRKEDVSWMKTLKPHAVEALKGRQFDLILDFSYMLDMAVALAFRDSEARLIVGSLADDRADQFHNVLIKASDPRTYDGLLFRYLSQLRLGL